MHATRILRHRGGDLLTTVREKLRTKDWVFTMNNPEPQQMESLHSPESKVRYLVYQLEVAETGTEHLQGYVEFVEGMTWPEVKEILGDEGALFVDPMDDNQLAQAILNLATDFKMREKLTNKMEIVLKSRSCSDVAQKHLDIYEKILT